MLIPKLLQNTFCKGRLCFIFCVFNLNSASFKFAPALENPCLPAQETGQFIQGVWKSMDNASLCRRGTLSSVLHPRGCL